MPTTAPRRAGAPGPTGPARRLAALSLSLALGAACGPPPEQGTSTGPLMAAGLDCLACHDGVGARRWTVAGTRLPAGTRIQLFDRDGQALTLVSNAVGNFYTDAPLAFPLVAVADGVRMPDPILAGGCNACHRP